MSHQAPSRRRSKKHPPVPAAGKMLTANPTFVGALAILAVVLALLALFPVLDTTAKRVVAVVLGVVWLVLFVVIDACWASRRLRPTLAAALIVLDTLIVPGIGIALYNRTVVPQPDFARLAPPRYHVVDKGMVTLEAGAVPQWWVKSEGPTATVSISKPVDLQVLEWHGDSQAWRVAFDGEQTKSSDGGTVIARDRGDEIGVVLATRMRPGQAQQLVFETTLEYTIPPVAEIGILDFVDGQLKLVGFATFPHGATYELVGREPQTRVSVTADWTTDVDLGCCPTRRFTQELGFPASYPGGITVLSDDRPWLGVDVISLHPDPPENSDARVIRVYGGSSAQSVLQPGDLLVDVEAKPNPTGAIHGPPFIRAVALHKSGDVVTINFVRGGSRQSATLELDSLLSFNAERRAGIDGNPQTPPPRSYFGAEVVDGSSPPSTQAGGISGARVTSISSGGPAATAGLIPGVLLVKVDGRVIASADDLRMEEFLVEAGKSVSVAYLDATATERQTIVTYGSSTSPSPSETVLSI